MGSIVTRDGKAVSPLLDDSNAAFRWLLRHQGMSTDWAIAHEGYAIVDVTARLEYLRGEIEAERISAGELAELQSLAEYIDAGDVVLLEWAGVPEDHR